MRVTIFLRALVAMLCAGLSGAGCGDGATSPTPVSGITVALSPPSGSTIATEGVPPGAFIHRGSGKLSVNVSITSSHKVPWAQLNLYLLSQDVSGSSYCGQNSPDSPSWTPLPEGRTVTYTVTGFQIFRVPCDVTGIRAMVHTRNNVHLGLPPQPNETVIDVTSPVTLHMR